MYICICIYSSDDATAVSPQRTGRDRRNGRDERDGRNGRDGRGRRDEERDRDRHRQGAPPCKGEV